MATSNKKLQCYVKPDLEYKLDQFKKERNITSDSEALNLILLEFFTVSPNTTQYDRFSEMVEIINKTVEVRLNPVQSQLDYLEGKYYKIARHLFSDESLLSTLEVIQSASLDCHEDTILKLNSNLNQSTSNLTKIEASNELEDIPTIDYSKSDSTKDEDSNLEVIQSDLLIEDALTTSTQKEVGDDLASTEDEDDLFNVDAQSIPIQDQVGESLVIQSEVIKDSEDSHLEVIQSDLLIEDDDEDSNLAVIQGESLIEDEDETTQIDAHIEPIKLEDDRDLDLIYNLEVVLDPQEPTKTKSAMALYLKTSAPNVTKWVKTEKWDKFPPGWSWNPEAGKNGLFESLI